MFEPEALDSAGSLIIISLAAGNLPHTCLKVMKSHLRECAARSDCHLLPANTAPPDRGKSWNPYAATLWCVCGRSSVIQMLEGLF